MRGADPGREAGYDVFEHATEEEFTTYTSRLQPVVLDAADSDELEKQESVSSACPVR